MPRSISRPIPLILPAEPDPDRMPIRYGDRNQLAEIHRRYWGPLAPRSLERWGLPWKISNGRAVSSVRAFIAEAEKRFDASPLIWGGRRSEAKHAA